MPLAQKYLAEDEVQLYHTHPHWKSLIKAFLWCVVLVTVLIAGTIVLISYLPSGSSSIVLWIWLLVILVLAAIFVLAPFLRWWGTTYTITDRRIISRVGVFNKSGHDLPLRRINDVSYERSFWDRILGCGTIVLTTGAETPVVVDDIPRVEEVHLLLNEILYDDTPGEDVEITRD